MNHKTDMQALAERLRLLLSGDAILAKSDFARAAIEQAIAALAGQSAGVPEDIAEGIEILDNFINSVRENGNYSTEATLTFIGQARQCFAAAPAPAGQSAAVPVWMPIETAPKTGRTLLLGYPNTLGKWRTTRGKWMSENYIAEYWEEPDDAEPGWYETPVEAEDIPNFWYIEPTHWMPLPPAPAASAPVSEPEQPPAENAAVRNKIAAALHYPEHWDTAAYPTLDHAAWEAIAAAKLTRSECAEQPSERVAQDCPHGVDDGACKQCYGEAVRGAKWALPQLKEGEEFVCGDGCGTTTPESYDFEYSREEFPDGRVESKTEKEWRASCCKADLMVYSNLEDTFTPIEDYIASAPTLGECRVNRYRSDICERGTKGCDRLAHAVVPPLKLQPQAAEPNRNQCDGCAVDAPVNARGNHAMPDGGHMGCTKDRYVERTAFENALKETYLMVDPLNPPPAGSYYRGQHEGIIAALKTMRENFARALLAKGE